MQDRSDALSTALGLAGFSCLAVGRIVYRRSHTESSEDVIDVTPVDSPERRSP